MKDPKLSGIVMNPYVKAKVKQQVVNDLLLKEKLSPLTINFVSKYMYSVHSKLDQTLQMRIE